MIGKHRDDDEDTDDDDGILICVYCVYVHLYHVCKMLYKEIRLRGGLWPRIMRAFLLAARVAW